MRLMLSWGRRSLIVIGGRRGGGQGGRMGGVILKCNYEGWRGSMGDVQ